MVRLNEIRRNEVAVEAPKSFDAGLVFIGVIHTPWTSRLDCPRQGRADGPVCRIEVAEPWVKALDGIEACERIEVLYWLHESRRDLVRQSPADDGETYGAFALRSPVRPNPIGTALVTLVKREGPALLVRGLDCLDGTPLIDLKPDRCQAPGRGFRDRVKSRRISFSAPATAKPADCHLRLRFEEFQWLAAPCQALPFLL